MFILNPNKLPFAMLFGISKIFWEPEVSTHLKTLTFGAETCFRQGMSYFRSENTYGHTCVYIYIYCKTCMLHMCVNIYIYMYVIIHTYHIYTVSSRTSIFDVSISVSIYYIQVKWQIQHHTA